MCLKAKRHPLSEVARMEQMIKTPGGLRLNFQLLTFGDLAFGQHQL